ncbi:MAG: hypothetical protein AB8G05_14720 [Oligoflexales bacterium]
MQNYNTIKKIIYSFLLLLCLNGNSAAESDIISDYEANINQSLVRNFDPSVDKKPANITISAKLKLRNKRYSIDFAKMLLGYRGDKFVAWEQYLDLYYDKDYLYLYTKELVVDQVQMPEYLVLAKVDPYGFLQWSPEFEAEFSLRTYRYKWSNRLIALIWGVWVNNADYPKFQLNARKSSLIMTDLASE